MKTSCKFVHVGICVEDLERSIHWYQKYFDFKEDKRFEKESMQIKGVLLSNESFALEILAPDKKGQASQQKGWNLVESLQNIGSNHFAISVSNIEQFYDSLKLDGQDLASELIDKRLFFLRDADGTLIEVKAG